MFEVRKYDKNKTMWLEKGAAVAAGERDAGTLGLLW